MAWIAVEMTVGAAQAEVLSDALLEIGAISVDVADAAAGTAAEEAIFDEPGGESRTGWGNNRLVALFHSDIDVQAAMALAAARAGLPVAPPARVARVEDQDWVRLTQSQFAPIRISPRLRIVPSWHASTEEDGIVIVLDPGLAFGTGSHPTTRLCLEWAVQWLAAGSRVIDYGCGSGILAIAAAKLGAGEVIGVDIDAQALEASRYNAARNRVSADFIAADAPAPEPADVVFANILSGPLRALAPLLAGLVKPGGRLVLSGILAAQSRALSDVYGAWFDMRPPGELDGWVRLEGAKRAGKERS